MNAHFIPLAILIGAALSSQPAINQAAVRVLGTPIAAAIVSVIVTLILMVAYLLATGAKVQAASLFNLPWWIVLGGAAGFLFVFGGVTVAPAIGAAVFFVCIVAGQLTGAALIDHFGAFGMDVRPVSLLRLVGISIVLLGVVLVIIGSR